MHRTILLVLLVMLALPGLAQQRPSAPGQQRPSADEAAFARLPVELQSMLKHLPPRDALHKVELARQNLIALGVPRPSPEQLRATVARVLAGDGGTTVEGASAGSTTFPPLSPLVSPHVPQR